MSTQLDRLNQEAGPALLKVAPNSAAGCLEHYPVLAQELLSWLGKKNGFYAYQTSLHVFPVNQNPDFMDLETWNQQKYWCGAYGELSQSCVFFAEDIFGGQFCFYQNGIYSFNPETGDKTFMGANLEAWAEQIFSKLDYWTGFSLAKQWIEQNGYLTPQQRLAPVQPFFLGGTYDIGNLKAVDALESLRFRGAMAQKLMTVPEGQNISLVFDI